MINFLVFIALLRVFGGFGLFLFLAYIIAKNNWTEIQQRFYDWQKEQKIIDLETLEKKQKKPKLKSFSFPSPNLSPMKFSWSFWAKIIPGVFALLVFLDGFTLIPAGSVGVIYDLGRGVIQEELDEGLQFKIPFWQSVNKIDTRLRAYTMSIDPGEGELYGDDSIESLTQDGQKVNVDITIQYRVPKNMAAEIYQEIGLDFESKVIRPGIRNVTRDVITGYDSTELFTQESRLEAQEKMQSKLSVIYEKNNLQLDSVLLRNIRFSETYLNAIEEKQVAQQRIQKAEYERQEAEKIKERKIIEAEADAEAIRLKGETLKANPEVIQYEFVQRTTDNIQWGILPDDIVPLFDLNKLKN